MFTPLTLDSLSTYRFQQGDNARALHSSSDQVVEMNPAMVSSIAPPPIANQQPTITVMKSSTSKRIEYIVDRSNVKQKESHHGDEKIIYDWNKLTPQERRVLERLNRRLKNLDLIEKLMAKKYDIKAVDGWWKNGRPLPNKIESQYDQITLKNPDGDLLKIKLDSSVACQNKGLLTDYDITCDFETLTEIDAQSLAREASRHGPTMMVSSSVDDGQSTPVSMVFNQGDKVKAINLDEFIRQIVDVDSEFNRPRFSSLKDNAVTAFDTLSSGNRNWVKTLNPNFQKNCEKLETINSLDSQARIRSNDASWEVNRNGQIQFLGELCGQTSSHSYIAQIMDDAIEKADSIPLDKVAFIQKKRF